MMGPTPSAFAAIATVDQHLRGLHHQTPTTVAVRCVGKPPGRNLHHPDRMAFLADEPQPFSGTPAAKCHKARSRTLPQRDLRTVLVEVVRNRRGLVGGHHP